MYLTLSEAKFLANKHGFALTAGGVDQYARRFAEKHSRFSVMLMNDDIRTWFRDGDQVKRRTLKRGTIPHTLLKGQLR